MGRIRGKLWRRVWIRDNDVVLLVTWDFKQDRKMLRIVNVILSDVIQVEQLDRQANLVHDKICFRPGTFSKSIAY